MKITKYNQSCLLIETNNKRFLVDPGNIGFEENLLNEWKNINYILVTHRQLSKEIMLNFILLKR